MAYPSLPGQPTDWFRSGVSAFARDEWAALVRLPGQVAVAAAYAQAVPAKTVAHGLAGIDAIAAGRASASRLVREVVSAIYVEAPAPPLPVATGAAASLAALTGAARMAAQALARHAGRADTDGYLSWLESIAARSCQARPGWSWGREPLVGDAERALLAALRRAFGR